MNPIKYAGDLYWDGVTALGVRDFLDFVLYNIMLAAVGAGAGYIVYRAGAVVAGFFA